MRDVAPIEQHVHGFLEMVRVIAASVVTILHWPPFLSLLGIRRAPNDLHIHYICELMREYARHLTSATTAKSREPDTARLFDKIAKTLGSIVDHANMMPKSEFATQPPCDPE